MEAVAQLITAVAALVTALGGAVALVVSAKRTSKRERPAAARSFGAALAEAAADGEITAEEIREIVEQVEGEQQ